MPLPLPRRTRTNPKEGYVHNRNVETFRTQGVGFSSGVLIQRTTLGTFISQRRERRSVGSGGSSKKLQFVLKDWSWADFYVCRRWIANADDDQFTEGDEDVYIAKPPLLRRTEFDGLTETVVVETLTGGSLTTANHFFSYQYYSATFRLKKELTAVGGSLIAQEQEIIIPRFVADELLYADSCADLQMLDLNGDPITLIAAADGRAWAQNP